MDIFKVTFVLFLTALCSTVCGRSLLRPADETMPRLTAQWADRKGKLYSITDSHLEEYPLFVVYKPEYFERHRLPANDISYRYCPDKKVSGATLDKLIKDLLKEIERGKRKYTHFTLLQDKDFNHTKAAGLAVFKFKEYPFILKLFIETPESFVNPWMKGILPVWFFYMAGGGNRHITGLTRIQNKIVISERLQANPKWAPFVDVPHKWFWTPEDPNMIRLTGHNIAGKETITTHIPGTYAIIAEAIEPSNEPTVFDRHKRKIALELCNTLDLFIDPHIDNFMVEKGSNKLVIIDTEHFPTLVGLKEKASYKTYVRWYLGLMKKASYDIFFRNKADRKAAQSATSNLRLFA